MGERKANEVVTAVIIASIFSFIIIWAADYVPATPWSPIDDALFTQLFVAPGIAVFASMTAYLLAQYIDIQLFHFWKNLPVVNTFGSGIIFPPSSPNL